MRLIVCSMSPMRYIRDIESFPQTARGGAVAIGNFDGLHRGHRAIIQTTCTLGNRDGCPTGVLTFSPHPRRFFKPDAPPFELMRLRDKLDALRHMNFVVALRFNETLAAMQAEEFVRTILHERMGIRHLICGENFVFGNNRAGTTDLLCQMGQTLGFCVHPAPLLTAHTGQTVYSSSTMRALLKTGDTLQVATILGHPYTINGRVKLGEQRGRTIGTPTMNIALSGHLPRFGVYAVRVRVCQHDAPTPWYGGVANIGVKPTFGKDTPLLEAHVFNFSDDVYGKPVAVELLDFIRDEQKFDGLEALKARITTDCNAARKIIHTLEKGPWAEYCAFL